MIQVTAQMRILLAIEPVDFRAGIDGLARVCREKLAADPFTGVVVVFRNRRATTIRLITFDGQGFWLATNYLSSHCTSFASGEASRDLRPWIPAARSASRFHRLECLVGGVVPGSS